MMWDIAWGIVLAFFLIQIIQTCFGLSIVALLAIPPLVWPILLALVIVLYGLAVDPIAIALLGVFGVLVFLGTRRGENARLRRFNDWMERRRLGKRIY